MCDQFKVKSLLGFGVEPNDPIIRAAGSLLQYARETQRNGLAHIRSLIKESRSEYLLLDAACRKNLEIDLNTGGQAEYTLAWIIDQCKTEGKSEA